MNTSTATTTKCRYRLNVHPAHGTCPGIPVPAGIETTPAAYTDIQVGDIITYGSCTTEHVVLDHPCTGNGQLIIECIKGRRDAVGAVRALFQLETAVYRVEPRAPATH